MQDVRLWALATDVDDLKMGPVCAMRIYGTAKEFIRELDTNVLANGMMINNAQNQPVQATGLECLIRALLRRFGPLQQELEIFVLNEIFSFRRLPNEDVDSVISRFELTRDRANVGANFDMSWVGFAYLLLTCIGLAKSTWPLLLGPTQGSLPQDEAQYQAFVQYLRRQGHLSDGSRHVDPVKNMSFFGVEPSELENVQTYYEAAPWTNHQPLQASFSAGSAYFESEQDADDMSSGKSGGSEPDLSDLYHLPYNVAGEQLYLAFRHAKGRWRKFSGPPRRFKGRRKGKGKRSKGGFKGSKGGGFGFPGSGKSFGGKSKGPRYFAEDGSESWGVAGLDYGNAWTYYDGQEEQYEDDDAVVYVGKGSFKRKNPKGKDGKTLLCSGCDSDEHFVKHCPNPRNKGNAGKGQPSRTFHSAQSSSAASGSHESSNSSSVDQGWGSMFFFSGQQPVLQNSNSEITMSDGTVINLESALESVPEQATRYYHVPERSQGNVATLSRAQESEHGKLSRQFAFVWFMPQAFHAQVRLRDGRESLLVDVGAWDNLAGSRVMKRVIERANSAGHGCAWQKLKKTLSIEGVGKSANEATEGVTAAICLEDGTVGSFQTAVVDDSELPALLGLNSLTKLKAVIDCEHKRLLLIGPGGYKIQLSPGSKVLQLHSAPTGHLLLPCTCWEEGKIVPGKPGVSF